MANLKPFGKIPSAMTSQSLQNGKQDLSSIAVKHLTPLEIKSLRQSMIDAHHQMMKMPLTTKVR